MIFFYILSLAFFVRGLYETWERTSNVFIANYIEAYLSIQVDDLGMMHISHALTHTQFDALQNASRYDKYPTTWTKKLVNYTIEGQLTALDVLSSQVGISRRREAPPQPNSSRYVFYVIKSSCRLLKNAQVLPVCRCLRVRLLALPRVAPLNRVLPISSLSLAPPSGEGSFVSSLPVCGASFEGAAVLGNSNVPPATNRFYRLEKGLTTQIPW